MKARIAAAIFGITVSVFAVGAVRADDPPPAPTDESEPAHTADPSTDHSPAEHEDSDHDHIAISSEPVPLLLDDDLPKRTRPLVEARAPLLGPGRLKRGITLPTGAVWTPALWVFGSYRTSINYVDQQGASDRLLEWPNRLDLFFNLRLSGTERLMVGFQPLNRERQFTTYTFDPEDLSGWQSEANLDIRTFFFEGDFGEIFPRLDPMDRKGLDIGFAIGRQQIEFEDGIMFNDQIDSIGVVRNGLSVPGIPKIRTTFFWGWGDINRGDGREDPNAQMLGAFGLIDTPGATIELDIAYTNSRVEGDSGGDGFYFGAGTTQRFGLINSTFRLNSSFALDEETNSVRDGTLLFAQLSTSPRGTHNVVYLNGFLGVDNYRSAARDPMVGGPLGNTGLLFAAVGLGRYPAALGSFADESWGGSLGYQWFWDTDRTQLALELGGRRSTDSGLDAVAIGTRVQRKLGRRYLIQLDGFVTEPQDDDTFYGLRFEFRVQF